MLPGMGRNGSASTLDFNQMREFPCGLAGAMSVGACLGLSLYWLALRKVNRELTMQAHAEIFQAKIKTPTIFSKIDKIHAADIVFSAAGSEQSLETARTKKDVAIHAMIAVGGWTTYVTLMNLRATMAGFIYPARVTDNLQAAPGYYCLCYGEIGSSIGHAVALVIAGDAAKSCAFFDPDLGSAVFPDFRSFAAWFAAAYWPMCDGLGGGKGCRYFFILKMMPAEKEVKLAPRIEVAARTAWDPSKGPPPMLSSIT